MLWQCPTRLISFALAVAEGSDLVHRFYLPVNSTVDQIYSEEIDLMYYLHQQYDVVEAMPAMERAVLLRRLVAIKERENAAREGKTEKDSLFNMPMPGLSAGATDEDIQQSKSIHGRLRIRARETKKPVAKPLIIPKKFRRHEDL